MTHARLADRRRPTGHVLSVASGAAEAPGGSVVVVVLPLAFLVHAVGDEQQDPEHDDESADRPQPPDQAVEDEEREKPQDPEPDDQADRLQPKSLVQSIIHAAPSVASLRRCPASAVPSLTGQRTACARMVRRPIDYARMYPRMGAGAVRQRRVDDERRRVVG